MKNISVKLYDSADTIGKTQLTTKDGKPTIIKAKAGINYEFFDHSIDRSPNHIVTKRVDDDVHISFERSGKDIDLIIEAFYSNGDQALMGIAEDGQYYYYIPDTGDVADYVTQLEADNPQGHALGGTGFEEPLWVGAVEGLGGIVPWLVGLGVLALAGGAYAWYKDTDDDFDDFGRDDVQMAVAGSTVTQNVVENDGDIDVSTVEIVGGGKALVVDGEGNWAVSDSGSIIFTPEDGLTGDPTPIRYTVNDNFGDTSRSIEVEVLYGPVVGIVGVDSVNEYDGSVEYQVTLDKAVEIDTTVTLQVANKAEGPSGNPTEDADISAEQTITVTIPVGETSAMVKVMIEDDQQFEGSEDYHIKITEVEAIFNGDNVGRVVDAQAYPADANLNIGGNEVVTTIIDDERGLELTKDTRITPENTPMKGNVLLNDAEGDASLMVNSFAIDTDGDGEVDKTYQAGDTAKITDKDGNEIGDIILQKEGESLFTPAQGFTGDVPTIEYTAQDSNGNIATADIVLSVTSVAQTSDVSESDVSEIDTKDVKPLGTSQNNSIDLSSLDKEEDVTVVEYPESMSFNLIVKVDDVIAITGDDNKLFINGDMSDSVELTQSEWKSSTAKFVTDNNTETTSDDVSYYVYSSVDGEASLYIESDMHVVI